MPQSTTPEVLEGMHQLMHSFKRHMLEAVREDGHGLTVMETRALAYFARHEGSTQRDLVRHAGHDKAQVARTAKALHERGLLESAPDPSDARSLRVHLTEQGLRVHRGMQQHRTRFEKALTAGFSAQERTTLLQLLERMHANVRES